VARHHFVKSKFREVYRRISGASRGFDGGAKVETFCLSGISGSPLVTLNYSYISLRKLSRHRRRFITTSAFSRSSGALSLWDRRKSSLLISVDILERSAIRSEPINPTHNYYAKQHPSNFQASSLEKINTFGTRRRQLLAYGRPAYRDHHGRQDEFSFSSSLLSSHLFSRLFHTVFLSISALILFFFPLILNRPLFLFLSAAPHVPTHVLAREIHSPSSGRCSLSSSSSLPLLMPSTPGLSLGFQQWRLHKSRYNVEMDQ